MDEGPKIGRDGRRMNPASMANLRAGNPNNSGGSGVAREVRAKAQEALAERLHVLTDILDNEASRDVDKAKAFEVLLRLSGIEVTKTATTDAEGNDLAPVVDDAAIEALERVLEVRRTQRRQEALS